mmetsp:Transcript_34523/g.39949  ORF Transcript_34523/g.39949 Transcript_34523/m.39949 type:complete len:149 (+) Transcript_34523:116-562(+)
MRGRHDWQGLSSHHQLHRKVLWTRRSSIQQLCDGHRIEKVPGYREQKKYGMLAQFFYLKKFQGVPLLQQSLRYVFLLCVGVIFLHFLKTLKRLLLPLVNGTKKNNAKNLKNCFPGCIYTYLLEQGYGYGYQKISFNCEQHETHGTKIY